MGYTLRCSNTSRSAGHFTIKLCFKTKMSRLLMLPELTQETNMNFCEITPPNISDRRYDLCSFTSGFRLQRACRNWCSVSRPTSSDPNQSDLPRHGLHKLQPWWFPGPGCCITSRPVWHHWCKGKRTNHIENLLSNYCFSWSKPKTATSTQMREALSFKMFQAHPSEQSSTQHGAHLTLQFSLQSKAEMKT